jgi:hypothetical protein
MCLQAVSTTTNRPIKQYHAHLAADVVRLPILRYADPEALISNNLVKRWSFASMHTGRQFSLDLTC